MKPSWGLSDKPAQASEMTKILNLRDNKRVLLSKSSIAVQLEVDALIPRHIRKKEEYAQPPLGEAGLVFGVGPSLTFSCRHTPEPSPVMSLITEALSLRCEVLSLIGWNTTLMDLDGHPFLKGSDIRDQGRVSCRGSAYECASPSLLRAGSLMPSTIARFCSSLIPAEYSP